MLRKILRLASVVGLLVTTAAAHQNFHQLWVNGASPGYQVGIRMPPSNNPVTNLKSNDIACNVNGSRVPSGVKTIPANGGDTIKVQWDSSTHPGPITHFLYGPVPDASMATGLGKWFKIDELSYVNGKWANEIMEAQNMTYSFKLPVGLPSGEYLLRSEMEALHSSTKIDSTQFYIGCAQLRIKGSGGTCRPTIELPGAYKDTADNIYISNFYYGFHATTFSAPGGPVATCRGGGATAPPPSPTVSSISRSRGTIHVETSAGSASGAAGTSEATTLTTSAKTASVSAGP